MKNENMNRFIWIISPILAVITILLVLRGARTDNELAAEKLRSETLLRENMNLDKENVVLRQRIADASDDYLDYSNTYCEKSDSSFWYFVVKAEKGDEEGMLKRKMNFYWHITLPGDHFDFRAAVRDINKKELYDDFYFQFITRLPMESRETYSY